MHSIRASLQYSSWRGIWCKRNKSWQCIHFTLLLTHNASCSLKFFLEIWSEQYLHSSGYIVQSFHRCYLSTFLAKIYKQNSHSLGAKEHFLTIWLSMSLRYSFNWHKGHGAVIKGHESSCFYKFIRTISSLQNSKAVHLATSRMHKAWWPSM